jgi:hypothetical protein
MFEFTKEKINNQLSIEDYQSFFEKISKKEIVEKPYDEEDFFLYTEANFKRSEKIKTKIELNKKLYNELNEGIAHWTWILITEPWCGDASFIQPVIEAICLAGDIDLKIALRDKNEDLMDAYLTNGGKSIPKLIVIDDQYNEVFNWGPRPAELQDQIENLLKTGGSYDDKLKLAHQWYHKHGNEAIQHELLNLIKKNK